MFRALLAAAALLLSSATNAIAANDAWLSDFHPYRLRLKLPQAGNGRISIDLSQIDTIRALQPIALEEMRLETFAFDKAVLYDPATGKQVGHFELVADNPLPIDGSFESLKQNGKSPWTGFTQEDMAFEKSADAARSPVLSITKHTVTNSKLAQPIKLRQGQFYLLDWKVWSGTDDNNIDVNLYNPARWYMAHLPGSYTPPLTPRETWTEMRSLKLANTEQAELRIGTAFIGTCKIAAMNLRPVSWRLIADLKQPSDALDLYCIGLGGHLMAPPPEKLLDKPPAKSVKVSVAAPELADLNPSGVLVAGQNLRAWTLPAALPLDPARLRLTAPRKASDKPLVLNVLPGQSANAVVIVESLTPYLRVDASTTGLPANVLFERIAEVPLFDGPYPAAKRIGGRFDARMPIDSELIPPTDSGLHAISVTFSAAADLAAGVHRGSISLKLRTPIPSEDTLSIPIELRVLPITVKPFRHFGAIISAPHLDLRYGGEGYLWNGATAGEFHGMTKGTPSLADKYRRSLIEHAIIPQHLMSQNITCEVIDRGKDKAPQLTNWDFKGMDEGIDNYVLKYDLPWMMIFHSNGDAMHALRLPNGVTYTFKPTAGEPNCVQVSEDEYYQLVADYFAAVAEHLDRRGVLERAVFLIDESSPESYSVIYRYTQAVRSTPKGAGIKFAHTTYKPSTFTQRLPDGSLRLDHALDIVMADNDEEFNNFEPEFNSRFSIRSKRNWVYYVETTHFTLDYAGLSTLLTPLKLRHFGADGWYCWASAVWNCPWKHDDEVGPRWKIGPLVNPWLNSFYHHGPGALALFYPPDPRGPASQPTEQIVPSHRLSLMREGSIARALLEALAARKDDSGQPLTVDNAKLAAAERELQEIYGNNPTQWYLSYHAFEQGLTDLYDAATTAPSGKEVKE